MLSRGDPDLTVTKVYYPQQGSIQIHQEQVCFCPPEFPAGYFWYGKRRHAVGRSPKWVQQLLEKGTNGDEGGPHDSPGDDQCPAEQEEVPGSSLEGEEDPNQHLGPGEDLGGEPPATEGDGGQEESRGRVESRYSLRRNVQPPARLMNVSSGREKRVMLQS